MSRSTLRDWFNAENDTTGKDTLTFLDSVSETLWRMIYGVYWLIREQIPRWFRRAWNKLQEFWKRAIRFFARLTVRIVRVSALLLVWLLMLAGPMWIYPSLLTLSWFAMVTVGSIYGLYRLKKESRKV